MMKRKLCGTSDRHLNEAVYLQLMYLFKLFKLFKPGWETESSGSEFIFFHQDVPQEPE